MLYLVKWKFGHRITHYIVQADNIIEDGICGTFWTLDKDGNSGPYPAGFFSRKHCEFRKIDESLFTVTS